MRVKVPSYIKRQRETSACTQDDPGHHIWEALHNRNCSTISILRNGLLSIPNTGPRSNGEKSLALITYEETYLSIHNQ